MAERKSEKTDGMMAEARKVARDTVLKCWPEFADVDPQVSERATHELHPVDATMLGVTNGATNTNAAEYIFTFAREVRTPEGYTIPRVARITVDSHHQVVKAVVSK